MLVFIRSTFRPVSFLFIGECLFHSYQLCLLVIFIASRDTVSNSFHSVISCMNNFPKIDAMIAGITAQVVSR